MADKFFDYFREIGVSLKDLVSATRKKSSSTSPGAASPGADTLSAEADAISKAADSFDEDLRVIGTTLKKLELQFNQGEISLSDYMAAFEVSETSKRERTKAAMENEKRKLAFDKKQEEEDKRSFEQRTKRNNMRKADDLSFANVEMRFNEDMGKLHKEWLQADDQYRKSLEKDMETLKKMARVKDIFAFMLTDTKSQLDNLASIAGGSVENIAKNLLKGFGVVGQAVGSILGSLISVAIKQIFELNDVLIKLTRSTGGMVTAATLGYDTVGLSIKGYTNLNEALLNANISSEEFSQTFGKLFEGGMGQIIGMKTNLKDAADQMSYFGLEASKMQKLWGTDMTGTVRGFTMNYHMGLKDATDVTKDFAHAAQGMGLDMRFAMKNLERVTQLANKYYFRSVTVMTKLAMLATNLGMNVDDLVEGSSKVNSITDVFKKQQELNAMEMGNWANNLTKIYAAQKTGRADVAASIEMSSMFKDLFSKGFVTTAEKKGPNGEIMGKGQITQQGKDALHMLGVSDETVGALQRMSDKAIKTGLTFDQLAGVGKKMTAAQQAASDRYDLENRTLGERFNIAVNLLMQEFINPLAELLKPLTIAFFDVIENLTKGIGMIVKFFATFPPLIWTFKFFGGVLDGISLAFKAFKNVLETVYDWVKSLIDGFTGMKRVLSEVGVDFESLGRLIGVTVGAALVLFSSTLIYKAVAAIVKFSYELIIKGIRALTMFTSSLMKSSEEIAIAGAMAGGKGKFQSVLGKAGAIGGALVAIWSLYDITKEWFEHDKNKDLENKEGGKGAVPINEKAWRQLLGNANANVANYTTQKIPVAEINRPTRGYESMDTYGKQAAAANNLNTVPQQKITTIVNVKSSGLYDSAQSAKVTNM